MLEVDEGRDDQERNEDPVNDRDRPRKSDPDGEKEKRGEQFDREIAKGDPAPAVRAFPAQPKPAEQRQVLMPRNRLLAGRTKRASRLIDREIARQPINADVQKRTDHRAENKGEDAKKEFVGSGGFHS